MVVAHFHGWLGELEVATEALLKFGDIRGHPHPHRVEHVIDAEPQRGVARREFLLDTQVDDAEGPHEKGPGEGSGIVKAADFQREIAGQSEGIRRKYVHAAEFHEGEQVLGVDPGPLPEPGGVDEHVPPGPRAEGRGYGERRRFLPLEVVGEHQLVVSTGDDPGLESGDGAVFLAVLQGDQGRLPAVVHFEVIGNGGLQRRVAGEESVRIEEEHEGGHVIKGRTGDPPAVRQIHGVVRVVRLGKEDAGKKESVLTVHDIFLFHHAQVGVGIFVTQPYFGGGVAPQLNIQCAVRGQDILHQFVLGGELAIGYPFLVHPGFHGYVVGKAGHRPFEAGGQVDFFAQGTAVIQFTHADADRRHLATPGQFLGVEIPRAVQVAVVIVGGIVIPVGEDIGIESQGFAFAERMLYVEVAAVMPPLVELHRGDVDALIRHAIDGGPRFVGGVHRPFGIVAGE